MYIGKAALLSGTTVKTIRHYETSAYCRRPCVKVSIGFTTSKVSSC